MLSTSLHLTFNPGKSTIFIFLSTLILLLIMLLLHAFPDVKDISNSFGFFLFAGGKLLNRYFKKLKVVCKRKRRKKVRRKPMEVQYFRDHSISK